MVSTSRWVHFPENPTLSIDEVHIWRVVVDQTDSRIRQLKDTLAVDKLTRAARFYFERDRRRFIVARGLLREIIGRYLGEEPKQLTFVYNQYGKPALATEIQRRRLSFNITHSNDRILYAITWDRAVGIDVERCRPIDDLEGIAGRFFSSQEQRALNSVPACQKQVAFFNCWTRMEAFVKAIGDGLSLPLDKFDVSLAPGKPAKILDIRKRDLDVSRWMIKAPRLSR